MAEKKLNELEFDELVRAGVEQDVDNIVKGESMFRRVFSLMNTASLWASYRSEAKWKATVRELEQMLGQARAQRPLLLTGPAETAPRDRWFLWWRRKDTGEPPMMVRWMEPSPNANQPGFFYAQGISCPNVNPAEMGAWSDLPAEPGRVEATHLAGA